MHTSSVEPSDHPRYLIGDKGAKFHLGLKDNNGDGRHYFTESFFDSNNLDLTLEGGVSAQLPIFAPTESSPLSGDADATSGLRSSRPR